MCQACDHPDRQALDTALLAGQALRVVSAYYHIPAASLYQHRLRHLATIDSIDAQPITHTVTFEGSRFEPGSCAVNVDSIESETISDDASPAPIDAEPALSPVSVDSERAEVSKLRRIVESIDSPPHQTPLQLVMERLAIQGPPVDPIRRVKHYLEEAARIWHEQVDEDRRTEERLQLILKEAFAREDMGLP
jgi:hypothetical protein